jgi:hypothetical protein
MSQLIIDGVEISTDSPALQSVLARAYQAKTRPLCACKPGGVNMYISKVAGQYLVKRMPDSGPDHEVMCESYDPPPELSGYGEVLGSAIKEDAETGITTLRFDFALQKTGSRPPPTSSETEHDSAKADSTKLTIRALLHYLWDQGRLTHWRPQWAGRRSWGTVYKQMQVALQGKQAKGGALSANVYIPAPFSPERRDSLVAERELVLSRLRSSGTERKLGILIGEVKSIETARFGFKLVIKQAPDFYFLVAEDLMRRIKKRFENEVALWGGVDGTHLMSVATFGVASTGLATIEEIAFMVTDEHWIPFGDLNEKMLIDRLNEQRRSYIKSLRYNMKKNKPLAVLELVDTDPPTALFVHPGDASEEYQAEFNELISASKLCSWSWDVTAPMPPVPLAWAQEEPLK